MGYYNNRPKTNIERIRDATERIAASGGSGGILPVTRTYNGSEYILDKTWQEI